MSNKEENDFLIKVMKYMDGCLSEDEIKSLEKEMALDPEKRQLFSETFIQAGSISENLENIQVEELKVIKNGNGQFLKSCATLLIGALIGASTFSAAQAMSEGKSIFANLFNYVDSFESKSTPLAKGIPLSSDIWSGDSTEISNALYEVIPMDGQAMLKLNKADYPGKPNPGGYISEMYRWFDISKLPENLKGEQSEVNVSAFFNSVKSPKDNGFHCGITVFSYDDIPKSLNPNTDSFQLENLCRSSATIQKVVLDNDLKSWQEVTVNMTLPQSAKFLLVRIAVSRDNMHKNAPGYEFPGQFLDQFKLQIKPRFITKKK